MLLRTEWVVLPGVVAIVILTRMRCGTCSTSFGDERLNSRLKLLRFWYTRIIDEYPVCSRKMCPA